jgi:hypothetical protein
MCPEYCRFQLNVLCLTLLPLAGSKALDWLLAGLDEVSHIPIPGGLLIVLMGFNPGQYSFRSFFRLFGIDGK